MGVQLVGDDKYPNKQSYSIDSGVSGCIEDLEGNGILDPIDPITLYTENRWEPGFGLSLPIVDQNANPVTFFGVTSMNDLYGKQIADITGYAAGRKLTSVMSKEGKFTEAKVYLLASYGQAELAGIGHAFANYYTALHELEAKEKEAAEK